MIVYDRGIAPGAGVFRRALGLTMTIRDAPVSLRLWIGEISEAVTD